MALICRDLRRFACSLSLFHPGGTPLPLPPFVHPSARLSVRPPVSSLSLSFGRGTRFPFHPTNPFRPISIFTHRFRVWCNRDERPRKGYRVTQKTLEIERSTSGGGGGDVPFLFLSLSRPSTSASFSHFPFSFSTREKAITRLERSRENKGRGFNGGRSGTKRCWLVYITDRSRIRSKGDYR